MNTKQLKALLLTSSEAVAQNVSVLKKLIGVDIVDTIIDKSPDGIQIPLKGTIEHDVAIIFGHQKPQLQMFDYLPSACIRITNGDIKNCCEGYSYGEVAVIISGAMHYSFKYAEDNCLCFYESERYSSYYAAVDAVQSDGLKVIASFGNCAGYVERCGLEFIELEPNIESLEVSSGLISTELEAIIKNNHSNAVLQSVFDGSFTGIITVDKAGAITGINSKAQFLLNCRNKILKHEYVMNIFPHLDKDILESALYEGSSVNGYRTSKGLQHYNVNIEPIFEKELPNGAVIAFNTVLKMNPEDVRETTGLKATRYFGDFSYISESFSYVIKSAKFAAYSDTPVLLIGESGTELTMFAQCIHNESNREKKGFIEIECNAWDSSHIEQMLFGNAIGGNGSKVQNAVEMADGGTIFLNHIDVLPQDIQYNVFLLISGWYTPANDVRRLRTNVRIIAATNRDLKELVRSNQFREDLYYSLNILKISIPPLRERAEDIEDITRFYIDKYSKEYSKYISLAKGCMDCIKNYTWPGNTMELKSFCKKIVITTPKRNVSEAFVRSILNYNDNIQIADDNAKRVTAVIDTKSEAAHIIEALRRNKGNRIKTAAELGISKTTLWRKMQKFGITEDYRW